MYKLGIREKSLKKVIGLAGFRGFIVPRSLKNAKSSCPVSIFPLLALARSVAKATRIARHSANVKRNPETHNVAKKTSNGKHEKTSPAILRDALKQAGGILLLAPNWVPRSFLTPGRRLKLHVDDI